MTQTPPPLPQTKPKKKGCVVALAVVVGIFVLLLIIGSIGISQQRKDFEENRSEIIAKAEKAVSEEDLSTLEELKRKYSAIEDEEFGELIKEIERLKNDELAERLGAIRTFKIYESENSSFGSRKRLTWRVVVEGSERPQDYAATLIYAARNLQEKTKAETVSVIAEMSRHSIEHGASQIVAMVNYIPDGKGWSGDDKSEVWDVKIPSSVPSPDVIRANAIYAQNRKRILNAFPDDLARQRNSFRVAVAGEMEITKEEADKLLLFVPPNASGNRYIYRGEELPFSSPEVRDQIVKELRN